MKKVGIWALVLTLLFLAACQPTPSPVPPLGDATMTATDTATTAVSTTTATDTTTATTTTTTAAQPVAKPKYDAVGTGMEKPQNFVPDVASYIVTIPLGERVSGLLNTALQGEINAFIEEYETETHLSEVRVLNGYMSVEVGGEFALYDLYEGKRIEFSDLFFKGTEFVPTLNRCIQRAIQKRIATAAPDEEINAEAFTGLKKDHTAFYLNRVFLPNSVYHIGQDIYAPIEGLHNESVLSIARDMQGVFEAEKIERCFRAYSAHTVNQPLENTHDVLELLDVTRYPDCPAEKVNAAILDICEKYVSIEAMNAWHVRVKGNDHPNKQSMGYGYTYCREIGDRYFWFTVERNIGSMGDLDYGVIAFFDRETGEEVPYNHFLKDGWESAAVWYDSSFDGVYYFGLKEEVSRLATIPDIADAMPMYFSQREGAYFLNLALPSGDVPLVTAVIPFEYVDWSR